MEIRKGKYVYRVDGEIMVEEPWDIRIEKDGTRHTRAARISPAYNVHMSLDAVETDTLKTYTFTYRKSAESEIVAQGQYRIENGKLLYRALETEAWQVEMLGDRLFFPLMRVFTGDFMRDVLERGGEAEAIIPFIEDPSQTSKLFTQTVSRRKVWSHETAPLAFKYLGGHYKSPVTVHTNEDGLMTRYFWETETGISWECTLAV